MAHKISSWYCALGACLFVTVGLPSLATPGVAKGQEGGMPNSKSAAFSVTGCLQKGVEAKGFFVKVEDGKTWELSSRTVKFDSHVGHKVTLTGTEAQRSKAVEAKLKESETTEAAGAEYGDMTVTGVKTISMTCGR